MLSLDGIMQGGANSTTHTSPATSNANANDMIVNAYSNAWPVRR